MSAPGNPLETYDVPSRRRWTVLSSICPTGNPGGAALAGARASAITIRSQRSLYVKESGGGFPKGTQGSSGTPPPVRTVHLVTAKQVSISYRKSWPRHAKGKVAEPDWTVRAQKAAASSGRRCARANQSGVVFDEAVAQNPPILTNSCSHPLILGEV